MKRAITFLLAACSLRPALGQTIINGGRSIKGAWDASSAISTKPAKSGTTLPATCGLGEQFFKTDAAAGQNLYFCTSANAWTQMTGGSGLPNQSGNAGKYLTTDGSTASWAVPVASVATAGAGNWFPFGYPQTVTSNLLGPAALTPRYYEVVLPFKLQISTAYVDEGSTADSGKYLGVALYDSNCNRLSPATTTGALLTTPTSRLTLSFTSFTVNPGSVFVAYASDGTAATFDGPSFGAGSYLLGGETTKRIFDGGNAVSVSTGTFTWPASCGTRSGVTTARPPHIVFVP